MNAPALPAYLQNRQSQGVAARATAGMGGILPPHISIAGNGFTLIDAAGNKMPLGQSMQACVVDISDFMNKRYYENDWTAGSDEPPTCFSRNGVSPSRDSQTPQANFCSECEWNKRGSDTSKLSGKPIKACRDEKDLALLLPQFPTMLFQLTVPPGSFKNWSAFIAPFKPGGPDVSDVLVSFGFQPQANGVMTFQATAYIDEATFAAREQALASKATDALVGRNDIPIAITHQPAAAAAAPTQAILQNYALLEGKQQSQQLRADQYIDAQGNVQQKPSPQGQPAQFGGQPQAQVPFGASAAQPASNVGAFGQTPQQPAQPAETRSPSESRAPRKRRTQAEIAADNAAKAAQAGGSPTPQPQGGQPVAPFPVQNQSGPGFGAAPAAQPGGFGQPGQPMGQPGSQSPTFGQPAAAASGNGASFGIQQGADPNVDPQLAAMLAQLGQS